jgi:hypothetical protein
LVYYYLIAGQQCGPVSFADLQASARRGGLFRDDLVWAPHFPDWAPASTVPGLFPGPAPVRATEAAGQGEGKKGLFDQFTAPVAEKLSAWTGW